MLPNRVAGYIYQRYADLTSAEVPTRPGTPIASVSQASLGSTLPMTPPPPKRELSIFEAPPNRPPTRDETKQYADLAFELDFIPILLRPGTSKIPLRPGWTNTTKEEAQLTFSKIKNGHNIGILTGKPSHIIVLDIEEENLPNWFKLLAMHPPIYTFTVESSGGGRHYYFQYDDNNPQLDQIINGVKRKLPVGKEDALVDVRTTGGQISWVGNYSPDVQRSYRVIEGYDGYTGDVTFARMPKWLVEGILHAQSQVGKKKRS
ncbi:MAG: bifunctional DNA primase/polymerase [Nitrososphaerales archaeon]